MTQPRPGDYVEVVYRGQLTAIDDDIELRLPGSAQGYYLPRDQAAVRRWPEMRVVDPPEPTAISTVVAGWATPDDARPESKYVFVLTSTDQDGDGMPCWQQPGSEHEYSWSNVLEYCAYGRTITE